MAHLSVAAGPVARGMDSLELECALLSAGGHRRGEAAALALGGGGDCVDHERAVFAGGPGCLGACVEAFPFLVCLEAVPFVCNEGEVLFG